MTQNIQMVILLLFVIVLFVYSLNILLCAILIVYGRLVYKNSIDDALRNKFYESDRLIREKIAISAAVVALKVDENYSPGKVFMPPPTAIVSAWQAVMRSDILKRQGRLR